MNTVFKCAFILFVFFVVMMSAWMRIISDEIQDTNKYLKRIVKLEQQTTTPELIIEENTLGGSNVK